ncbi:MAG: FecR domain-containing protein [Tannerellaceae bacterium]|jgi:ferric-dicitrate binding protein FerR (iron transport regulator)|nr:FecR domain-containing protein [Tannerellaceae bacterium]
MTQEIHTKPDTDRAWNLLFSRLQQDGLIPGKEEKKHPKQLRPALRRWAVAVVLVLCAGAAALMLLQRNDGEAADSRLLTLHNEKGAVTLVTTLEDGSIVYLADDTRLHYPEHFMPGKREVSLSGRALFDVQGNRERPFLIKTETARIEVTGTAFNVQSTGIHSFELSVRQGEVKVTLTKNGQYLYAKAGETVTLTPSGRLQAGETADTGQFSPYNGRIRFKDEKLANILRVINNKGTGIVLQTTPALENRKITVTFADATPENVAELICMAFNLLCKKENNTLLITEP